MSDARDDEPAYYYLVEHRIDKYGREYGKRVVGRINARLSRKTVFDDWHEDVIEYMREHAEFYVDNTEDVKENTAYGHQSILDFTMCAEPAMKWVLEFVPSGISRETEKKVSEGSIA